MKTFPKDTATLIVLKKGEELLVALGDYAKTHNLKGGWVHIIGGAAKVTLGFYDSTIRDYRWQEFNEQLEIVGLQGNLAYIDGEPFWHIHGSFSRADYTTIAGHVKECVIGLTGEVFLQHHEYTLTRYYDDDTGLKLLAEPE